MNDFTQRKYWHPYIGRFDPCPPITTKSYETPPQLYIGFQPEGLPQFEPHEALRRGTLWPAFYSSYSKSNQFGRE